MTYITGMKNTINPKFYKGILRKILVPMFSSLEYEGMY